MTEELKPCPFCGEDAEIPDYRTSGLRTVEWFIQCQRCPAVIECCDTEKEAVKAWNARAKGESND